MVYILDIYILQMLYFYAPLSGNISWIYGALQIQNIIIR